MNISKNIVVLIIFCFSFGIVMAQNDALIHKYKFDGNLNDAIADSHGVFSDGWYSPTEIDNFITGHDGTEKGALHFDGAGGSGYIIFVGRWSAVKEGKDGEMTLTLWALWYGRYDDGTQDIINKRDNYEPPDMVWGFNNPGGADNLNVSIRRRGMFADSQQGMDVDVWTHMAVSMDGTNAYFYKNGTHYETLPYEYGTGWNARIHMGSAGNSDGSFREVDAYNGALDDVRFYSRKLTDAEILSIYQGTDPPIAIEDKISTVPAQFELAQNFPNPFNPSTTIKYTLAKNTQTEIVVYDLIGNKVATLVDGLQNIGTHKVVWDASGLSAGIYIYQLKTEDFIQSKKMILVK